MMQTLLTGLNEQYVMEVDSDVAYDEQEDDLVHMYTPQQCPKSPSLVDIQTSGHLLLQGAGEHKITLCFSR